MFLLYGSSSDGMAHESRKKRREKNKKPSYCVLFPLRFTLFLMDGSARNSERAMPLPLSTSLDLSLSRINRCLGEKSRRGKDQDGKFDGISQLRQRRLNILFLSLA